MRSDEEEGCRRTLLAGEGREGRGRAAVEKLPY